MPSTVQVRIDGVAQPFDIDFVTRRWSSTADVHESYFPLVCELDGKRYELYSDNTIAEVE